MKILITGAAGYIGSVLTKNLLDQGYQVRGLDCLNFGGESLLGVYSQRNFEFLKGDIRRKDDVVKALRGVDAVVNLAAIVGDPACAKQPEVARETNWEAAKMLFDLSQKSGRVKRFVSASTCSNYGKMSGTGYLNEESPLNPVSLYAELKVQFERYMLSAKKVKGFATTSLRFATAFGLAPRIRFDLTVNEFVKEAALGRELVIYGEQFWRPYCHVYDIARACQLVLESNVQKVDRQVFGVGDTKENYQKKMLAEEITKIIPAANIRFVHKNEDPRDYRVDFSKIRRTLGFKIERNVPFGMRELYACIRDGIIQEPDSQRYKNV